MSKSGRPKLAADVRRSSKLTITVSAADMLSIETAARADGKPVAVWCREVLLKAAVIRMCEEAAGEANAPGGCQ